VGSTPIDSIGLPLDQVPANVQTLAAPSDDTVSQLGDLLNENLGSVSVSNASGAYYQNDVNYRGFQATSPPLRVGLCRSTGTGAHEHALRLEHLLGPDPDQCARGGGRAAGANPMFGLNTLGGALVARSKNSEPTRRSSAPCRSFRRKALR
jgi:hypothetical protein